VLSFTVPPGVTALCPGGDKPRPSHDLTVHVAEPPPPGAALTVHTDLEQCKSIRVPIVLPSGSPPRE
jgi:hypothetical protein